MLPEICSQKIILHLVTHKSVWDWTRHQIHKNMYDFGKKFNDKLKCTKPMKQGLIKWLWEQSQSTNKDSLLYALVDWLINVESMAYHGIDWCQSKKNTGHSKFTCTNN